VAAWDAVTRQVRSDLADGKNGEATGGAVWAVLEAVVGTKGLGNVTKLGAVGKAAEAANAGSKVLPKTSKEFQFPGAGRSGAGVKNFVGPPNTIARGASPGRVFVTDGEGRVVFDVTRDRVKPVVPGQGFIPGDGRKLTPTSPQPRRGWAGLMNCGVTEMAEDSLRCSPSELMMTFREALIAFIPTAERLLLEWGDGCQHRDWERLAETLFDVCVRGPIESDAEHDDAEYPLPRYDIDAVSYGTSSWLSATSEGTDPPAAFIRLMTELKPFDTVQVAILDPETLVPIDRVRLAFTDVDFAFIRRSSGEADVEVREIEAVD
jgi:hypothetical protein